MNTELFHQYKKINETIIFLQWRSFGVGLFFAPIGIFLGYIFIKSISKGAPSGFSLFFAIFALSTICIFIFGFINSIVFAKIKNINESLLRLSSNPKSINEICSQIDLLGKIIKYYLPWASWMEQSLQADAFNINNLISNEIYFANNLLQNLRSDLQFRLTEQQKSLESAKSEVEKNIQGTPELNQVSELQKARLDRQIEQFEELQRVLVKV